MTTKRPAKASVSASTETKPEKVRGRSVHKVPPGAAKSVKPPKAGKLPNALQKALQPSKDLSAIVGPAVLPRGEVVSKVWAYIKANKLQNPENGREILADDKLKKIFGKDKVSMFEMNKHLAKHLT